MKRIITIIFAALMVFSTMSFAAEVSKKVAESPAPAVKVVKAKKHHKKHKKHSHKKYAVKKIAPAAKK